jgi:hypothetical protein
MTGLYHNPVANRDPLLGKKVLKVVVPGQSSQSQVLAYFIIGISPKKVRNVMLAGLNKLTLHSKG